VIKLHPTVDAVFVFLPGIQQKLHL
jgi:hypothetical protein